MTVSPNKAKAPAGTEAIEEKQLSAPIIPITQRMGNARAFAREAAHVAQQYPVFPCKADKTPHIKGWPTNATQDPVQIARWAAQWPDALIGVPTGAVSGLLVLDVDVDPDKGKDGFAALAAAGIELPDTRKHLTRRGGAHYLLNYPLWAEKTRSTTNAGGLDGVDVRGDGGYVIWWPACGGDVENSQTYAEVPQWLEDALQAERPAKGADVPSTTTAPILTREQIARCLAVLDPSMGYDAWLRIGMALHYVLGDDGLEVWDSWSAGGANYKGIEDLRTHWVSFGKPNGDPITGRYLVKLANENGAGIDLRGPASLDEFEDVSTPGDDDADKALRFAVVPAQEFVKRPAPTWIIKGVIPRAQLVVLYGASGAGKSFLALDMGAAIARGEPWRERTTKPGRVVYIAAEGAGGFVSRLRAWEQHHGVRVGNMGVIDAAPNLMLKPDALDVAKAIKASGGADVVIVDTLAQVSPGANENAGEDMGRVLSHCKGIHQATGAVVVLVHHAGKDLDRGARGWSGLRAAADAEIEVSRPTESGPRLARITKQKDGEDGLEWGFSLPVIQIGEDEDGEPITSCVAVATDAPKPAPKRKPLGTWEKLALESLGELTLGGDVEAAQVVQHMVARTITPEAGKRDRRREYARQGLEAVCRGGHGFTLESDRVKTVS